MATARKSRAKKLVEPKSGAFTLPDADALAASAAAKTQAVAASDDFKPGRVRGLDYSQWASAVVDLSEMEANPQRV